MSNRQDIELKAAAEHQNEDHYTKAAIVPEGHKHDPALDLLGSDRVDMTDEQVSGAI